MNQPLVFMHRSNCHSTFENIDIMRNKLRQRAHVTNACTHCKQIRKKCSGTATCSNCRKRKVECIFVKPNEKRGRKPKQRISNYCGEFSYFKCDLSTHTTPQTQTATNILSDESPTDIKNAIPTVYELSTHPGLPNMPTNKPNQEILINNIDNNDSKSNSLQIIEHSFPHPSPPMNFILNRITSTNNNNNNYSATIIDNSLSSSFITSNQSISINNEQEADILIYSQDYPFHNSSISEICEHNITSNPISPSGIYMDCPHIPIIEFDSFELGICEYRYYTNDPTHQIETNMSYPQQPTSQVDSLQLGIYENSFTSNPCNLISSSELLDSTNIQHFDDDSVNNNY
ncbi:2825_t:CDS:2 [Scutellospora calospora]|uniref:2825_t:CDS:1 n=1 Tax=Scutellospora calospora TaxID=85575 RepID=A0ACA9K339_9GLOM|nr:2825_t:CDS:2 [Scutellospora calospora]